QPGGDAGPDGHLVGVVLGHGDRLRLIRPSGSPTAGPPATGNPWCSPRSPARGCRWSGPTRQGGRPLRSPGGTVGGRPVGCSSCRARHRARRVAGAAPARAAGRRRPGHVAGCAGRRVVVLLGRRSEGGPACLSRPPTPPPDLVHLSPGNV